MEATNLILLKADYTRLRGLGNVHGLSDELDRAVLVAPEEIPPSVVTMNSRLVYVDESTGTRREVELAYPEEADPARGRISVLAPVGSALIGLSAGHTIDWEFPGGTTHRLRVEQVLSQPKPADDAL